MRFTFPEGSGSQGWKGRAGMSGAGIPPPAPERDQQREKPGMDRAGSSAGGTAGDSRDGDGDRNRIDTGMGTGTGMG